MDSDELRRLAAEANGETWTYLEKSNLSADEQSEMLGCAFASLYLWVKAGGTSLHAARGHWLISRVYCVLGEGRLGSAHAELCAAHTEAASDRKDFEDMYVLEARARACALNGDLDQASRLRNAAVALCEVIKNAEDKRIAEGDLRAQPWFGLEVAG
jgi:hypothetical protein